ncbi:MAG: hypothetical protein WC430_01280 [Patescibacteria group bacterium]
MPQDFLNGNVNVGEAVYQWEVKEYEKYQRGRRWYAIMGFVGISILAYALITSNYLFALIVALFGIILFLFDMQEPAKVQFAITTTGIILGEKFYRWSEFDSFWIVYAPPEVKNLYFKTNGVFRHRLQVPLLDSDPRPVRDYIGRFLNEDLEQEEEPLSDRLARVFKIH